MTIRVLNAPVFDDSDVMSKDFTSPNPVVESEYG